MKLHLANSMMDFSDTAQFTEQNARLAQAGGARPGPVECGTYLPEVAGHLPWMTVFATSGTQAQKGGERCRIATVG